MLRGVRITVALAACLVAAFLIDPLCALIGPVALVLIYAVRQRDVVVAVSCAGAALPIGATIIAYYTRGEIIAAVMTLGLLVPVMVASFLYLLGTAPRTARWMFCGMIVLATFALAPAEIRLGVRLLQLRDEVRAIQSYVATTRAESGRAPANLNAYSWQHPALHSNVSYRFDHQGQYMVLFWPGSSDVAHWYHETSGWGYHPD